MRRRKLGIARPGSTYEAAPLRVLFLTLLARRLSPSRGYGGASVKKCRFGECRRAPLRFRLRMPPKSWRYEINDLVLPLVFFDCAGIRFSVPSWEFCFFHFLTRLLPSRWYGEGGQKMSFWECVGQCWWFGEFGGLSRERHEHPVAVYMTYPAAEGTEQIRLCLALLEKMRRTRFCIDTAASTYLLAWPISYWSERSYGLAEEGAV